MLRSILTVLLALPTALPGAFATETGIRSLEDRVARLVSPGIRRIDKHLARIEQKLPSLPGLYNGPRGSRFGFHSETIFHQEEPHHLQIDLGKPRLIDSVVLVPIHLPALGSAGEGYGFPLRFKIEVSDSASSGFQPLVDHTDRDYPNPGSYPIKFPAGKLSGRYVRVTSTKHVPAKEGFIWAMEEIMVLSGNYNIGATKTRSATSHQELFPNWSLQRVNDGISRVSNPHNTDPSPSNGFLSAPSASGKDPKWIVIDLGKSLPIEEVRIIPTSSEDPEVVGGRGFPEALSLELSNDPEFETTVWRTTKFRHPLGYPWNSSFVRTCNGKPGRYIRVISSLLFARGNRHSLALAEVQAYSGGKNVALWKDVHVSDQTSRADTDRWAPKFLVDGYSSTHKLIEIPDYIDLIIERGELERKQDQLLRQQEEDIAFALVSVTAGTGAIGGLAIMGWIWGIFRQRTLRLRDAARLREQIARDLHDDIGSNLAGIVLISEVGSNLKGISAEARDDFREIKETAKHTSDAMRDIVWLTHVGNATTYDLFMKMRESVGLIVGHLETSIRASPPSFKVRPIGLQARRHFFFAFKEALNNVRKHAHATNVRILFEVSLHQVTFEVTDDGNGFDPDKNVDSSGHGLENFRRRAERVNGYYEIKSVPTQGTTVKFSTPLTQEKYRENQ